MPRVEHRIEYRNGIRLHAAECGSGPLVILIHGFPESWYSWRHQLPVLAGAGFHVVAIDVRGYGRSSKPAAIADYGMVNHVADIVTLVESRSQGPATVVGHDWGAPIAWTSALLRPDLFRGVAGLSVPYSPPAPVSALKPTQRMRALGGDNEFYIEYFQQPGRAETEIEPDVRQWLLGFYWCASGDVENGPNIALVAPGTRLRDKFVYPETLPHWLTESDLDFYASEFERSGFHGPLARYRNVDRDWMDLAAFANRPVDIPALFIGGSRDGPTVWGAAAIQRFPATLPKLFKSEILDGAGHWIQQERAEETNALLLEFLAAIH
jgi:pimeloyl-ACP methyl ester carboxylesterase